MLEVAVDPGRLFYEDDPLFELWLADLLDRIANKKREQAAAAKTRKG